MSVSQKQKQDIEVDKIELDDMKSRVSFDLNRVAEERASIIQEQRTFQD